MCRSDLGPEIGFEAVGLVDSSLDTVAVFAQNNFLPDEIKHTTGEKVSFDELWYGPGSSYRIRVKSLADSFGWFDFQA